MSELKTSIDEAVERMVELDAAGCGLVVLRCDREADIRRVVGKYPHLYAPEFRTKNSPPFKYDNIKESLGGGAIKDFLAVTEYPEPSSPEAVNALRQWLEAGLRQPSVGMRHRLMYIPNLPELVGPDAGNGRRERTLEQLQYLRLIRAVCEEKKNGLSHTLIVAGCTDGVMCGDLAEYSYVVDVGCPGKDEIDEIIWEAFREFGGPRPGLELATVNELSELMRGMRRDDIRSVISLAYARSEHPLSDGAERLFAAALDGKRQRISGVRGLRWINNADSSEIGGMGAVRAWLATRRAAFNYTYAARKCRVSPPKGALLAGLPGCGKTLFAKYASHLLSDGKTNRTPVLQLDLSAMLGKWQGEAEGNFAQALRMIESVAPCVVVVDEIEKFFGGVADGNNESSRHIFASLLEWMQSERDKSVLVIATANRVDRLPPELKRKGRFDETFFVGIPTRKNCEEILRIHLRRKAAVLAADFDYDRVIASFLKAAAAARRYFNGADLESIVNSAFCTLFSRLEAEIVGRIQKGEAFGAENCYPASIVETALLDELKGTRSFFDNNMDDAAAYWLVMRELHFRSSDDEDLFAGIDYLEDEGRFKFSGVDSKNYVDSLRAQAARASRAGDYDGAFRCDLAVRIFMRFEQQRKREAR